MPHHPQHNRSGMLVPIVAVLVLFAPLSAFAYEIQQGVFDDTPYPDIPPKTEAPPTDSGNHGTGGSGGGILYIPASSASASSTGQAPTQENTNTRNASQAAVAALPGLQVITASESPDASSSEAQTPPPQGDINRIASNPAVLNWWWLLLLAVLLSLLFFGKRRKDSNSSEK